MSKGSMIVHVRFPEEIYSKMLGAISNRNHYSFSDPMNLSDWIRKCVSDKLDHLQRSKKRSRDPVQENK
jgi:hypothetical protein